MANRTVVPFGPQHPVLPEPIHLDLVLEDETVVEAVPKIGYVHLGFEKLVEKMDFNELVYVADRICGICAFIHSMAYCDAAAVGTQQPDRLAPRHMQAHVFDDAARFVGLRQIMDRKQALAVESGGFPIGGAGLEGRRRFSLFVRRRGSPEACVARRLVGIVA